MKAKKIHEGLLPVKVMSKEQLDELFNWIDNDIASNVDTRLVPNSNTDIEIDPISVNDATEAIIKSLKELKIISIHDEG